MRTPHAQGSIHPCLNVFTEYLQNRLIEKQNMRWARKSSNAELDAHYRLHSHLFRQQDAAFLDVPG